MTPLIVLAATIVVCTLAPIAVTARYNATEDGHTFTAAFAAVICRAVRRTC